jgi:CrcB protein
MDVQKVIWLAVAGAAGTLARYGIGSLVHRFVQSPLPWGTLVINGTGCLLFGLVWSATAEHLSLRADIRSIVLIGFMGAYTTFSTFAFETAAMMRDGEWLMAFANFAGQNLLGLVLMFIGLALGRLL